jgi:tRNA-specific 2-thiouridylase
LSTAPARAGQVVALDGHVLAEHDGHDRFTIGQRRGIGVASGEPLYVVGKDPDTGRVTVGPRDALAVRELTLRDVELYRDASRVDRVKLRYRSEPVPCAVTTALRSGKYPRIELMLTESFLAAAPGQVACLLAGDLVVGHGLIADKEMSNAA